ncbi:MAG TPA: glycosyltransferase N-terminal domain-containing protein [Fimbriimonadaceae bacterium]|nr:glycosyltransferase N-terminal domain-containing protein [Fimbriimonadaceae bacterium]
MSLTKAHHPSKPFADRAYRCWLDPSLLFWSLVLLLWSPFALFHRVRRALFRDKHDPFVKERWTAELQTPETTRALLAKNGPHVVLVGASFGEILIIDKITKALRGARPEAKVTWAIRDPATVEHVKKMHPGQSVVYWPYDWLTPVTRWISRTRPDIVVMLERFRFPIFVRANKRCGADVVLVNGRCQPRKFFFSTGRLYYKWLFAGFRALFFQNERYLENAKPLLSPRTHAQAIGDIKFDLSHLPIDPEKAAAVDRWLASLGDLPLLAVGSTEDLEEETFVIDAFLSVRKTTPVRLLVAPRRLVRLEELLNLIKSKGLTYSLRSKMDGDADVYVLDSFGELSYAYQFATAAYVAGALSGMGHNVIEPLEWGIPVSYGTVRGHFGLIQEACERAGVGTRIGSVSQLAIHWSGILSSEQSKAEIHDQCKRMIEQHRGAISATMDEVLALIDEHEKGSER